MYPRFTTWSGEQVEVMNLDFVPGVLGDRICECGSSRYFSVRVILANGQRAYKAMCEKCKKIVETI